MTVPRLLYESNHRILTKQQVLLNAGSYNLICTSKIFKMYTTFRKVILFIISSLSMCVTINGVWIGEQTTYTHN
jgi:hypothetical protein